MNQLETNLTLWAICSIVLFEILIIICLCRCWFNRIRPKKFYVKHDEYEYLRNTHGGTQSKYQSAILRPPQADELAHIGTLRVSNSHGAFSNLGFYRDEKDKRISSGQLPSNPQWIELQPPIINTIQLPAANDELYPYRQRHPTFIDFRPYRDDVDDEMENYRLESLQHPAILLPQVHRSDTSTEYYGVQYTNAVPRSILKNGVSLTPPIDYSSNAYLQVNRSRTSSKNDDSPRTSVKINTDQSIPNDHPSNVFEKRIPTELILSSASSKHRMKFAHVNQLNNIEWEVPGEFRTMFQSNHERNPPAILPSRIPKLSQLGTRLNQSDYLWKDNHTQQQAFEY